MTDNMADFNGFGLSGIAGLRKGNPMACGTNGHMHEDIPSSALSASGSTGLSQPDIRHPVSGHKNITSSQPSVCRDRAGWRAGDGSMQRQSKVTTTFSAVPGVFAVSRASKAFSKGKVWLMILAY